MTDQITFSEAIEDSKKFKKRHLLLGNGFSIGCCPDVFCYKSLFEEADFSKNPKIKEVFDDIKTTDFERVMRAFDDSFRIIKIYLENEMEIFKGVEGGRENLKNIFIQTISRKHPKKAEIGNEKLRVCEEFLKYFLGKSKSGNIYTLNYDLLLYWTLMNARNHSSHDHARLTSSDGFIKRNEGTIEEKIVWIGGNNQNVYYLHGALHFFNYGKDLIKLTLHNIY